MLRFKRFLSEGISKNFAWNFSGNYPDLFDDKNPSTQFWKDLIASSNVSKEEVGELANYTLNSYWANQYLRGTNSGISSTKEQIDALDRLFDKHGKAIDRPMTVYRTIQNADPDVWKDVLKRSRQGEGFIDPAFLSTTTNKHFAAKHGFNMPNTKILQIQVPPNTKFLPNPWSIKQFTGEDEVLFGRNTHMNIDPEPRSVNLHSAVETPTRSLRTRDTVDIHRASIIPPVDPDVSKGWPRLLTKVDKFGKFLPFIGLPLAGMAITQRAQAGDYVGAGLEAASEVADSVPVLGTPISAGIQGYLGYHDMTPEEQENFRKNRGAKPTEQSRRKAEETYSRQNY